jgi:hypothetical protein
MHIGGAFSNVVVRADDPSAAGQAVSPVTDAPAAGIVIATGAGALELELVADTGFLSSPLRSEERR